MDGSSATRVGARCITAVKKQGDVNDFLLIGICLCLNAPEGVLASGSFKVAGVPASWLKLRNILRNSKT